MATKVVILCKMKDVKELESYAKAKGWDIIKTIITNSLNGIALFDVRLMANYLEYNYLLIKNFEAFLMPPDEMTEEVRYLKKER